MGLTKTEGFSEDILFFSNLLKAIAHPSRLAIILFLIDKKQCIGNDILEELPIAQPTLSRHLKELKESGLIKGNIDGASICYCVDTVVLQKANNILNKVLGASIQTQTTCC